MHTINVQTQNKKFKTSRSLFGIFFEDISRAGDGGLYAELLRNRAFEDSIIPEGCSYNSESQEITTSIGWKTSFQNADKIPSWDANEDVLMHMSYSDTLNANRKTCLKIDYRKKGSSIYNSGFHGINVVKDEGYSFYMFAKSSVPNFKVTVSLRGKSNEVYSSYDFLVDSGEYKKYNCIFLSNSSDGDANFHITAESEGELTIGFTSLFPQNTFNKRLNGVRPDLAQRLKDLSPQFLRFPGGCIVEGFNKESIMRFKNTIGPVWERPSHWLLWNYRTTNGLGFHEYLQLCEDLDVDALYVVNCGMSCQGRGPEYFTQDELDELLRDIFNAIEYATSNKESYWGLKRATNGHPQPFNLKYIEIGNENYGEIYQKNYLYIYNALKNKYPHLLFIANQHRETVTLPADIIDEHYYSDVDFFASNHDLYDSYDRKGPKVYVGEYAVTTGANGGNLKAALGEAAYLTGIERNQDVVTMTSYAPLFANRNHMNWSPNLILFDKSMSYVIPTYYMLKIFCENIGDYVVDYLLTTQGYSQSRKGGPGFFNTCKGDMFRNVTINSSPCDNFYDTTNRFKMDDTTSHLPWDNKYFRIFGVADLRNYTVEMEAKPADSKNISISFWNDLNSKSYFDWKIEGSKSKIIQWNGFSRLFLDEKDGIVIKEDDFNKMKIVLMEDTYKCYLNGELIHNSMLKKSPIITASTAIDAVKNEAIIKIVNLSSKAEDVQVTLDVKTGDTASVILLTSDSEEDVNSFEEEKVKPKTIKI
ncbi:alpha-L-arabinofuranosidase C-terminal domain-containing protein, partial [Clostridium sp.]|uniref:alpha-L-arabinofuranosidase C-terminal domain-containing protein n=1 Tax=Clostridium sp. TaxID=1506 RepID=UPI0026364258